jgi:hypothetical protein
LQDKYNIGLLTVNIEFIWLGAKRARLSPRFSALSNKFYIYRQQTNIVYNPVSFGTQPSRLTIIDILIFLEHNNHKILAYDCNDNILVFYFYFYICFVVSYYEYYRIWYFKRQITLSLDKLYIAYAFWLYANI